MYAAYSSVCRYLHAQFVSNNSTTAIQTNLCVTIFVLCISHVCAYQNFNTVVVIKGKCFPLSVGCASYQVGGRSDLIFTHYGGIMGAAEENSQNSWRRRKTVFISVMINVEKKTKRCSSNSVDKGEIPKYLKNSIFNG